MFPNGELHRLLENTDNYMFYVITPLFIMRFPNIHYREIELFSSKELIKTGMKVKFQEPTDKASSLFPM